MPLNRLGILLALALTGCSQGVRYGPNSTMVPLGDPVQGCKAYRLVIEGGFAPTAVYFRRPDGSFTENRAEADCPRPEPPAGG